MCGIAGIYYYGEPSRAVDQGLLARMTRTLVHRGPDDDGIFTGQGIGLGHRRLSIVDLSPAGAQPMTNESRTNWICYNGEFYNHQQFRDRLTVEGHHFRGRSDTETLLHLLDADGPEALAKTAGIFAFAYWESREQRLTLARDHMGVKQLYYHDNGKRIVFASEIKALLVCPDVPRQIDPEGVNEYLHFHAPLFERTMFAGIRQLRPGEYLQIGRNGCKQRIYWKLEAQEQHVDNVAAKVEELRERLTEVVGSQLMSDVPVASFYSGGIDSSVVTAYAVRNGYRPRCFGVHFTDQQVIDERPYQEAGAKALGVDLELATVDGKDFPNELMHLMHSQDQPMIGPAMFPMNKVCALAAKYSKVCLGGQAGDEIFGGYARYALAHPARIVQYSLQKPHRGPRGGSAATQGPRVKGNLWRQLMDKRNLSRLASHASILLDWRASYFQHFADVPVAEWSRVFAHPSMVDRDACWQTFCEVINRSPMVDPGDKLMHWDTQAYLPGLFHQDDRMSMANSLETRVPLADPRLVEFAFSLPFELKFHAGASKWILRQAVADLLPEWVVNRRKVGFDTPVKHWLQGMHADFAHDLLLSNRARTRGFWNAAGVEAALANTGSRHWLTVVWKMLCLEAWAVTCFDNLNDQQASTAVPEICVQPEASHLPAKSVRQSAQARIKSKASAGIFELRNDGFMPLLKRAVWESKVHSGSTTRQAEAAVASISKGTDYAQVGFNNGRLFADPASVAMVMKDRMRGRELETLRKAAADATFGRIESFSRSTRDYGNPLRWNRNPATGRYWNNTQKWYKALPSLDAPGDIKMAWEPARFPQAYLMARAAAFHPELAEQLGEAFIDQVNGFLDRNPFPYGIQWASGQEIVFRLLAWLFALDTFAALGCDVAGLQQRLKKHLVECGAQLDAHVPYSRDFVYNNHLISEALGLCLPSMVLSGVVLPERWAREGLEILDCEADRQIYPDGGYIQQSNNYHRVAMQMYLAAVAMRNAQGEDVPEPWLAAMDRSLDFLLAQQNPADGRLPNYGANDGALPLRLTGCNYSDFRPLLQMLSIATRGERLYEPGPWDESTAWLLGPEALDLPLRILKHASVSFADTGFHLLRAEQAENFSLFRCGSLRDRFSQIDMLHLDVWWKGQNVLVDAGSYLYNGASSWHAYCMAGRSHNTITVDGQDQMQHIRKFKVGPSTRARLLQFADSEQMTVCTGEHYGFQRFDPSCVHRRSVLLCKNDVWVVADTVLSKQAHTARLHWLAGAFPYAVVDGSLVLHTEKGDFYVTIVDARGNSYALDVVSGQTEPPRGWQSRYYAEKFAVPSLAVEGSGTGQIVFVSILSAFKPVIGVDGSQWKLEGGEQAIQFAISDKGFLQPQPEASSESAA